MAKLQRVRQAEADRRRGVSVPADLLDFADFLLLQLIIDARWDKFKPILKSSKIFNVYMDRLGAFRNTAMHSRPLLAHEHALIEGITGEILSLVAVWRSEKGPDMNYYPVATEISDGYGNVLRPGMHVTSVKLRPGDLVRIKCIGTDPHGRELSWVLRTMSQSGSMILEDQAKGDEVELRWSVHDHQVREFSYVNITMTSDGKYHREGDIDLQFACSYEVLPPSAASNDGTDQQT